MIEALDPAQPGDVLKPHVKTQVKINGIFVKFSSNYTTTRDKPLCLLNDVVISLPLFARDVEHVGAGAVVAAVRGDRERHEHVRRSGSQCVAGV